MSSHHLPEVLMKKVDEYVDSLAPQIQPRVEAELETFQQKTIDSLEDQIVGAFRSLFNDDKDAQGGKRGLNDNVPDAYGSKSLPFADEISKLTRSFSDLAGGASDDLRDIFDLTEGNNNNNTGDRSRSGGGGGGKSDGFKTFLSAAVDVVQDQFDKGHGGGQKFQLDGLLGVISNTVKDAARNPEEKARLITPEIKEKVGSELREQHKPIAERFTKIALEHIKKWLRGNTSSRDLGEGARGEIEDQVKDLVKGLGGLFGSKSKHHSSGGEGTRGLGDSDRAGPGEEGKEGPRGFSKLISEKLSTGLARVHREVRLEFRKILAEIEKKLFELLPDQFQKPLEKILGGNPFDSQLDRDVGATTRGPGGGGGGDRGFDEIKAKLLSKIRGLIQKVQETLRESILGVVNGGHRVFERQSWVFVQNMVEQKVQKYLPKVKITVPDDIGNEGVSVGAPAHNIQLGGGHQNVPSALQASKPEQQQQPQTSFAPPPSQSTSTYPPPPPPPQNYSPQQQQPPSYESQPGYNPSSPYPAEKKDQHQQQYYPPPPPGPPPQQLQQEAPSYQYTPQQHHQHHQQHQQYDPSPQSATSQYGNPPPYGGSSQQYPPPPLELDSQEVKPAPPSKPQEYRPQESQPFSGQEYKPYKPPQQQDDQNQPPASGGHEYKPYRPQGYQSGESQYGGQGQGYGQNQPY